MRWRLAAIGVAVLSLTASASVGAAVDAAPALAVVGYQDADSPTGLIDRSAAALTTVGVDGINLTPSGASVTPVDADALRQLARAHRSHLKAELLVANFGVDDFDEPIAYRMLSDPAKLAHVAQLVADMVNAQGWDGVSVDLESLTRRDRGGLTRFLAALRADLPGRSLAIAVQNNLSSAAYDANGYDLPAIAATVDRVELMTYDQHGPWEDTPGPVGALAWQRAGLHALLADVPRGHVDLGVAGYGYAWRPHFNDTLTDAQARALAGSRARWDPRVGEWTATLADGSTLWWSDARSYRVRAQLARTEGLQGLAVWSLGQSDPIATT